MTFCPRTEGRFHDGSLLLSYQGVERRHRVIPVPRDSQANYERILSTVTLDCQPMLVWVDEAGGNGGFHLGDVIVIGKRDLDDIAQRMWEESVRPTSAVTMHQRCFGHSLAQMRAAAELFLKAHEVGHACAPCFVQSVACESNADRVAGRIAHSLGWSEHLGRLFMYVIGCHTPQCTTHPNRLERVRHLLHGLEEQRLADASASRQRYRAHARRFAAAM